ncbi:MAG: alpha/beta hydrolase [Anaerolineae bacterium]|nr:alpha/beta hydrolase [Anaerolineae bacterium]
MPSIITQQGLLHYEVMGRGKPLIFLHGWLGSYRIWRESLRHFSKNYRCYTIDLWGFGESGEREEQTTEADRETYKVENFVDMVAEFMDRMGMDKVPLIGHSMGGTTSLRFAIKYPKRVKGVTVIGSPIDGESLAPLLKIAGRPFFAKATFAFFPIFRWFMRVYYSKKISIDPEFPAIMDEDLQSLTLQSFLWSINDLRQVNLVETLNKVRVPVLGMYGDKDIIVDPYEWQTLLKGTDQAKIARFPNAGHFIMLDNPERYKQELTDFLNTLSPFLPEGWKKDQR